MDYKSRVSGKPFWISLLGYTIGQNKLLQISPTLETTCPEDFITYVPKK